MDEREAIHFVLELAREHAISESVAEYVEPKLLRPYHVQQQAFAIVEELLSQPGVKLNADKRA